MAIMMLSRATLATTEAAAPAPDGFQGTPAATRRRVRALDAFIDLVLEGKLPPTAEQVAERAGISMATFFRYFETLNTLRYDAAARMLEGFPLLHVPKDGNWEAMQCSCSNAAAARWAPDKPPPQ